MITQIFQRFKHRSELVTSQLYNEQTFYLAFARDLNKCKSELLIESPFITTRRITALMPTLKQLIARGVKITVNTRPLEEHDSIMRSSAEEGVRLLQSININVLLTNGHHRKLVMFDRKILYEGSLNVLSQRNSCEVMRRIESEQLAKQMLEFVKIKRFLD